jgi:ubiquinone biosynthesis protein UbiJ
MYQQVVCAVLETLINKALLFDLNDNISQLSLNQKCLVVNLSELGFPLSFIVSTNKILVTSLTEQPDCTIRTSIKTLIALKKEQQLTELIKQDKLDIEGDLKVAQQFAQLAETLDIDWQTELAKHIGDVPTYKLTQLGKKLGEKLNFAAKQIEADSTEWLVHEKRLVVPRSETSSFNLQVSELDVRAEALQEQFDRIELLLESTSNTALDSTSDKPITDTKEASE